MLYLLAADATAAAHFAFVGYVVVGGFLAWRWPRTIWAHLAAVAWGFGTIAVGYDCPLTYLEDWARRRAGASGLPPEGFIAHYLTGVIYPESALGLIRALVALCVLASWTGYVLLRRRASIAHRPDRSGAAR